MAENVSVADWYSQEKVHGHPLGFHGVAFLLSFLNPINIPPGGEAGGRGCYDNILKGS